MASLLRNSAYQHIRQRLLRRELAPGKRVSELAIAKEMGISRAPVREAINQLASEGLVMQIPNAGTFVKSPNRIDLENLYQLRMWVEGEAAAETARRVSERRLGQMQDALDEMKKAATDHATTEEKYLSGTLLFRHVTNDLGFHLALIRGCGNRMVSKMVGHHHMMSQVWCAPAEAHDQDNLERVYDEHFTIFEAVRSGDSDEARRLMQRHLETACKNALDRYDWHQRQQAAERVEEFVWPETLREVVVQMELEDGDITEQPERDAVAGTSA